MPLQFTKMHGLGNDYVLVSLFDQTVTDPAELARRISDRHRGVGSDGLILLAPPAGTGADVRMIMFNPDGSRAQMCGNGIRCLAKLAYERGLACHNPMRVETDAGVLALDLTLDSGNRVASVRVDMGEPILDPQRIPVALRGEHVVDTSIPFREYVLRVTCVSMGNPHAVCFEPDLARVPLAQWGPELERHPLFPQRINVHFVQVLQPDRVRMITWERGAGLTQACGSGAAAVCVAGVLNRVTQRSLHVESSLAPDVSRLARGQTPGRSAEPPVAADVSSDERARGELHVQWDEPTNHVFLTGPAEEVFVGQWP